jgi:hypothetical protein
VKPENSNELNLSGNSAGFQPPPLCEAVTAEDEHFIFVFKPSSHPLIQEYVTGAGVELATHEEPVRHDISERAPTGTARSTTFRYATARMLRRSTGSRSRSATLAMK